MVLFFLWRSSRWAEEGRRSDGKERRSQFEVRSREGRKEVRIELTCRGKHLSSKVAVDGSDLRTSDVAEESASFAEDG